MGVLPLNLMFDMEIDPLALNLLKELISNHPDIYIVVASSWRDSLSLEKFKSVFDPFGDSITDLTSDCLTKEKSIELWIKNNVIDDLIILDDEILFDSSHILFNKQIKTTMNHGLTEFHIKLIESYFNKNKKNSDRLS